MSTSDAFEKLGVFYLGRRFDATTETVTDENVLYDAKDLTTHGVCIGMTGSGKTGLCIALIEEAAIDGIPVIAIDPKGDLANLCLTFPELRATDFEPWVDPADAARKGQDRAAYAASVAEAWTRGLAQWGQDGARIARLRAAAEVALFTPGSSAGHSLSIVRSFAAPDAATLADPDALRDRIGGTVSSLLALIGVDADPIRSREYVLLASIVDHAWRSGHSLDLGALIRGVAEPPFERIGVLDLESFYPAKDRFALAQSLNALVASPSFAAWLHGEPLSIDTLLRAPDGRPRISVLSIAHLPERERMFFVTLLLHEIVAWMRRQPGTGSLRALVYMDEVMGYAPPTANPPSKTPLLTLFKQARAFGVGVVLATQNPVDLDYKALSNAGTWFLGRLQTERDRERVQDGLETVNAGASLDRRALGDLLSRLPSRVFVMKNVHDDQPTLLHARWAMSYLGGPLTQAQIKTLVAPARAQKPAPAHAAAPPAPSAAPASSARPVLPPEVDEVFIDPVRFAPPGATIVYAPSLLAEVSAHYVSAKDGIDAWRTLSLLAPLGGDERAVADVFAGAPAYAASALGLANEPIAGARFDALPARVTKAASLRTWGKQAKDAVFREHGLALLACPALGLTANPDESKAAFAARVDLALREGRDRDVEALRARFAAKLERLQARERTALERLERERAQYGDAKMQSTITVATSVLGALFGGRRLSRVASAARGVSRASAQRGDVGRAEDSLEAIRSEIDALERACQAEVDALVASLAVPPAIVETSVKARKADLALDRLVLAWTPWIEANGSRTPLVDSPRSGS